MQKFCYRCGALEEEKGPLIEGLCHECFLSENPLVKAPTRVELKVCKRCGAYFLENAWHDIERDASAEHIEAAKKAVTSEIEILERGPAGIRYVGFEDSEGIDVSSKAEYSSPETVVTDVEVRGKLFDFQEEPLSDRAEAEVKLVKTTCKVCERQRAGYYEAVLQVRGEEDLSERRISEIFRALGDEVLKVHDRSREEFVSQVKKRHGGVDFYTSSAKLARSLARSLKKKYGARVDESAELVGQTEDGEEKYRVTVVARLSS